MITNASKLREKKFTLYQERDQEKRERFIKSLEETLSK
jgi:hypothetical protein